MKNPSAFIAGVLRAAVFLLASALAGKAETSVTWRCSTAGSPWQDKGTLKIIQGDATTEKHYGVLFDSRKYQTIDGWGGCFNEKGWKALSVLSNQDRDRVMKALFDPQDGLRLTYGRTPIGASDYALSPYSLDDTQDDFSLSHFSIDRDKKLLLPYIMAAQAIQPGLKVWGVPWSPPGWMKDSNALIKGKIKTDAKTMNALALYFEKYVQAYLAEGVHLFMVMPQNEPTISSNYPGCLWTGGQLHDFIKNYLGPKFTSDAIPCEIWLGTLQSSDYTYVAPTVDDSAAFSFIKGMGFQWGGDRSCAMVYREHPEIKLMQSETICGRHENNWHYAEEQYDLIKRYFESGISSYMLWNMVLDETGKSTANWAQCSPVVINKHTKKITYTPQFYLFKHFSYYVQPGAVRVLMSGNFSEQIGFINPNGDVVMVLVNKGAEEMPVALQFGGEEIKPTLPAHSFSTLLIHHSA
jgi:glucosylceramidase